VRGSTVVFEKFTRSDAACIQVWVRAGAAFETEAESGAAHFLEHMLFQSRPDRFGGRALGECIEAAGGVANAWTSQDYTVVHATCPAGSLEEVAAALIHHVLAPDLPADALERERGVILQEIAREQENPSRSCLRILFEQRYAGHPYGRRVLGTRESVSRLSREALRVFHDRHYRADNLIVSVVARREADEVLACLDRELARFERAAPAVRTRIPAAPNHAAGVRIVEREAAEAYFAIGFPVPHLFHPSVPALDCFSALLGEMRGSRLEAWRRETGLVNDIETTSYTPEHGGTFLLQGSTHPDRLEAALNGIGEVLAESVATPPSESDLAAVRQDLQASAMRIAETAQGRAGRLGHETASAGRPGYLHRYLARVFRLTPEQVASTAQAYLLPRRATLVLTGPVAGLKVPRMPAAAVRTIETPGPERRAGPTGPVILHWRDRSHGTVAVRLQAAGGLERETPKDNGLHALLARLHLSGARGRSGPEILREFDSLGAQVGLNAGYSTIAAWLDVPAGQVMPAVRLLAECLAEPTLDSRDLRREADLLVEAVRSRMDRPAGLLVRELLALLFQGDPYGLDPLGTPESLASMTPERLRSALPVWNPRSLTLAVVGDHDPEPIQQAVGAALAVHSGDPVPIATDPARASGMGRFREIPGPFQQSHVGLAWSGPALADPDLIEVDLVVTALAMMSGPLFRVLRDELGIAYQVGATMSAMRRGGFLLVTAAVRPSTEDAALRAMQDILARILARGPDALDLLRRAAIHMAGTHALSFQKKGAVAHWMCSYDGTPLGYDSFRDLARRIRSIEPERAVSAASRFFAAEPAVVILRPEAAGSRHAAV